MPQLVVGRVHDVGLCPVARGGPVLHLLEDDGPVPDDGVGVGFDPQVGGSHSQQLRRGDRGGRLWGQKNPTASQKMSKVPSCILAVRPAQKLFRVGGSGDKTKPQGVKTSKFPSCVLAVRLHQNPFGERGSGDKNKP